MRITLRVIGIGPGNPRQITLEAIDAMQDVGAFLVLDKGSGASALTEARREILRQYVPGGARVIEIPDPPRDRNPDDYQREVRRWHGARADILERTLRAEIADGGVAAFLVWGDPSLYDSTLRIVDDLAAREGLEVAVEVVPGVTSASALTAAHAITANRVGAAVHITTGRRLAASATAPDDTQIVMLDGDLAFRRTAAPDAHLWWGACLGTADEVLVSGRVGDVTDRIVAERERLRERTGWVMDIYLLRRA